VFFFFFFFFEGGVGVIYFTKTSLFIL